MNFNIKILLLYLLLIIYNNYQFNSIRVAYIFSGSARSFITPIVKTTIRFNLLLSFCPIDSDCIFDVYIRISSNDNIHEGLDSNGRLIAGNNEFLSQIKNSIEFLRPPNNSNGFIVVNFIEIGSESEKKEMLNHNKDDILHKIYRELDPRRYSMFFNRYASYQMMLNSERTYNLTYTWIVHSRLDFAYGEPIKPYYKWSLSYLYAPDTWFADVPDTFGLIPRNISDTYYSLDKLFDNNVICLGGPNFNTNNLLTNYLMQSNYSTNEIITIQNQDCRKMFPGSYLDYNKKLKNTWSFAGFSEYILKRKLEKYGYSYDNGIIKYVPFFLYLIRYPFRPICFYLSTQYLIGYVITTQAANTALLIGCNNMIHDLTYYHYDSNENCIFQTKSNSNLTSCLLQSNYSDNNFMPYRIRFHNRCLTSNITNSYNLYQSLCVNYNRNNFMEMYIENQLFNLYPKLTTPQKITLYFTQSNHLRLCLTVSIDKHNDIFPSNCIYKPNNLFQQLFVVNRIKQTDILTSVIQIQWYNQINNISYVVCHKRKSLHLQSQLDIKLNDSNNRNCLFRLERAVSSDRPHGNGITVGKYPV